MNFFYDECSVIDFTRLSPADKDYIFLMRNDERISSFMYTKHVDKKRHDAFIEGLKSDLYRRYWCVKKGEQVLGVISLSRIDLAHLRAYIGLYKNPFFKGSVGDMLVSMLENVALEFGLHALFLEVLEDNARAISLYERHGYVLAGLLQDYVKEGNTYKNVLIYSKVME